MDGEEDGEKVAPSGSESQKPSNIEEDDEDQVFAKEIDGWDLNGLCIRIIIKIFKKLGLPIKYNFKSILSLSLHYPCGQRKKPSIWSLDCV